MHFVNLLEFLQKELKHQKVTSNQMHLALQKRGETAAVV
jgi:hypothetical protein